MNAKETMNALLGGETVIMQSQEGYTVLVKLSEEGMLVCHTDDETEFHEPLYTGFNHAEGIVEEYPLTFEEAIRAMLDGKVVVTNDLYPFFRQRFHDGHFEYKEEGETEWMESYFPPCEQKGTKWKVVE